MDDTRTVYSECPLPDLLSLSAVISFFARRYTKDFVFKGETHDFAEIVCVTDGKVGITAGKNVYVLSAGQMIVHPPEEFHAIWSDRDTAPEAIIFSFRAERFPELERKVFRLSPENLATIRELFKDAKQCFLFNDFLVKSVKKGFELQACALKKNLETLLLSVFSEKQDGDAKYTSRSAENYAEILSYLENNLDKNISLKALSAACNLSIPAVEKTVNRFSGCGVLAYFNTLKLKRAKELLSDGISVKETALRLGYSNQNYFSSRFKKHTGFSPSEWSKRFARTFLTD